MQTNGQQLGTCTPKWSSLLSRIDIASSPSTNSICPLSSEQLLFPSIATCSSLIKQSETELAGVAISSSQRLISSEILSDHISHLQGWPIKSLKSDESDRVQRERVESMPRALTCAGDGMQESAHPQMENASTSTSAQAAREDTRSPLASAEFERDWELLERRGRFERKSEKGSDWGEGDVGFAPKYKCGFMFSDSDTGNSRATSCTEFELLVPWPPSKSLRMWRQLKQSKIIIDCSRSQHRSRSTSLRTTSRRTPIKTLFGQLQWHSEKAFGPGQTHVLKKDFPSPGTTQG